MKTLMNSQIEYGNKMKLEGPKSICLNNLRLIRLECFLLLPRSPAILNMMIRSILYSFSCGSGGMLKCIVLWTSLQTLANLLHVVF
jgi:hypothetical protein